GVDSGAPQCDAVFDVGRHEEHVGVGVANTPGQVGEVGGTRRVWEGGGQHLPAALDLPLGPVGDGPAVDVVDIGHRVAQRFGGVELRPELVADEGDGGVPQVGAHWRHPDEVGASSDTVVGL